MPRGLNGRPYAISEFVSSVPNIPSDHHRSPSWRGAPLEFKVSLYDQVAGWLLALVTLLGLCVGVLLLMWLSGKVFVAQKPVPVVFQDVGGGRPDGVIGESMQLDSPNPAQVAAESDVREPEFEQTLSAISAAVAARQVDLADPALTDQNDARGGGKMQGTGRRAGRGEGEGLPGYPRAQRWEIRFGEGSTLSDYARELAFFKIELGAVGATNQILYAANLDQAVPTRRTGGRDEEERLYMSWRSGRLQDADRELLRRAGVPTEGKIVVQFYPADVENALALLEKQFQGLDAHQIRKTVFAVRAKGRGFEFYVVEQAPLEG